MNRHVTGWVFVAIQAVLLGALILLPGHDHWPTPDWLTSAGYGLVFAGLAAIAIASLRLGSALTPTPVPTRRGQLTTSGFYRYVRHPIYTGVLAIVIGLVLRSGSILSLAIGIGTVVFFNLKAQWEETQLADRYPGYEEYAAATPRFVPQPWRR